jgi:rhodanese-related sulfurtransferase
MVKYISSRLLAKQLVFLLSTLLLCGFSWFTPTWESINEKIDRKYPEVRNMTVDELLLKINNNAQLTIVDVRAPQEYAVSHLPGAINVTDEEHFEKTTSSTIVAYCSVGLRSAVFAKKLQDRGYTQVYNLRGSIFEWAEKGYPLYRNGTRVFVVHPYDEKWGTLVDKSLHAYSPK